MQKEKKENILSMNLGTFACIVLFGLRTGTENIRDYAGLYTKDPFLHRATQPSIGIYLLLVTKGNNP